MRIAVISDIHGNLDAFESVLADIDTQSVERTISLGDNIGYGAEPEAVLIRLRSIGIQSIRGNHEMALIDPAARSWFNPLARKSIMHAAATLSHEAVQYVRSLPTSFHLDQCWFVHGFPPYSPTIYLFQANEPDIRQGMNATGCTICFVGHTHTLEIITLDEDGMEHQELPCGTVTLDRTKRYLINIGSVGQPRDRNQDAKYIVYDTETAVLDVRFVPYDRESAARKIIAAGLPESHAARLL